MRIMGCDLHARQQTLAMLDTATGEVVHVALKHEGNQVQEFYSQLPPPVRVGIEATESNARSAIRQGFERRNRGSRNTIQSLGAQSLPHHGPYAGNET
jgi:hypothetical protein